MVIKFPHISPPPDILPHHWEDWKWQMRASLSHLSHFEARFQLTPEERKGLMACGQALLIGRIKHLFHSRAMYQMF